MTKGGEISMTIDMHSVNKANFAIFHWFGGEFRPRFTNLKKERKIFFVQKIHARTKIFLCNLWGKLTDNLLLMKKTILSGLLRALGQKKSATVS
jgi:hypothetical protein